MAKFRADFDVKSSLVLPPESEPLVLRGDTPQFEMTFRNAEVDSSGHVPALVIQVIADCDSIEHVAAQFRSILAEQLDILSFATHSAFIIDQCRRVLDWEPFQKSRRIRPARKFDPLYPPDPELACDLMQTVQNIARARLSNHVLRALKLFRNGVIERQLEDQFEDFWLAIETIAEGTKEPTRLPIPCPKCQGALFCTECDDTPTRRPMARQAIRQLIGAIASDPNDVYQQLVRTRDHLLHGRSKDSVESDIGRSLSDLVNDAAAVAWHAIFREIPPLDGEVHFGHRDGTFAYGDLVFTADMLFEHQGDGPHPTDDMIPNVQISMLSRFGQPIDPRS